VISHALKWGYVMNKDDKSRHIDLTADAQLLRWGLGASAYHSTLGDLRKGKVAARVNGRAEFYLAEGSAKGAFYFPNVTGWMLRYTWTDPKNGQTHTFDMGAVRFGVELNLAASVGASLVLEAGVEVQLMPGKEKGPDGQLKQTQLLKGAPGKVGDDLAVAVDVSTGKAEARVKRGAGARADVEAFAGAKASAELVGALQWQKPESTEFANFVKIGPGVDGRAGIGLSAYLDIHYDGGRFLFKAQASLCLGVGAKGKLVLEADAHLMGEFGLWFYHQLRNCDYRMLKHMEVEAFRAFCHLQYLAVAKGAELGVDMLDAPDMIGRRLIAWGQEQHNKEALAYNVIRDPTKVLVATPETAGLILYQLTNERFWVIKPDLDLRRQAAMQIIRCLQTRRQFDNLCQHLTDQVTRKIDRQEGEDQLWKFFASSWELGQEAATAEIAGMSKDLARVPDALKRPKTGTWAEQFYAKIRSLPWEPAPGYNLAFNDTHQFDMQMGEHFTFNPYKEWEGGETLDA